MTEPQDIQFTVKYTGGTFQPLAARVLVVLCGLLSKIERCDPSDLEPSLYVAYGGIAALHLVGILSADEDRLWRDRAQLVALLRGWRSGATADEVRARIAELEKKLGIVS